MAQLIYPADRHADLAARSLILSVLQQLVSGRGPLEVAAASGEIVERLGAGTEGPGDLLDAVVSIEELQHVPLPPPGERDRLSSGERTSYLSDLALAIHDAAATNLASLMLEHARLLEAAVEERLQPALGPGGAPHFLAALAGRLAGLRLELAADRQDLERQRASLTPRYALAEAESGRESSGAARCRQLVDEEAVLVFDIERHAAAIDLLSHLADRVAEWRQQVESLLATCDSLIEELLAEEERSRRARPDPGAAAYEIGAPRPEPAPRATGSEAETFLRWLQSDRRATPSALLSIGRGELKDLLHRFAARQPGVRAVRERRVEDVLAGMPDAERRAHLRQLVALASPPAGEGEAGAAARAEGPGGGACTSYVFGVEDAARTLLSEAELEKLLPQGATARLASTADPHRLFCIRVGESSGLPGPS